MFPKQLFFQIAKIFLPSTNFKNRLARKHVWSSSKSIALIVQRCPTALPTTHKLVRAHHLLSTSKDSTSQAEGLD